MRRKKERFLTGTITVLCMFLLFSGAAIAEPGWDDLSGVPTTSSVSHQSGQYNDAEFDRVLRMEQRLFTDQKYHQKPLRSYKRNYPSSFRVIDSWFDVYWDTPEFKTKSRSDGASLMAFMFRDIVSFQPNGGRSFFSINDFINIGLGRWGGSRRAYAVYGSYGLQDFSRKNKKLVQKQPVLTLLMVNKKTGVHLRKTCLLNTYKLVIIILLG